MKIRNLIFLFPLLLLSCPRAPSIEGYGEAEGFTLQKDGQENAVSAEILSGGRIYRYEFRDRQKGFRNAVSGETAFTVAVPLERVAVCTSTMLILLEEIGEAQTVAGLDGNYTSLEFFRNRIETGKIRMLAEGFKLDRERLKALAPEAVFFSPAAGDNEEMRKIIDCGAVPVPIEDWRESTLLGRAQWAELEAAFFGKNRLAAALFRETREKYRTLINRIGKRQVSPKVLFHLPVNGQWRMPSGGSFWTSAVRDAGAFYPVADSSSETVLLDLETVFSRFSDASLWLIHSGSYPDRKAFVSAAVSSWGDPRLSRFPPLEDACIAVNDRMVDDRGFNGFYDYSPLHPDWLLEDLAALMDGDEPTRFYRILK